MAQEKDGEGIDLDIKDAMEGHERFRAAVREGPGLLSEPGRARAEAAPAVDRLRRQPRACRRRSPAPIRASCSRFATSPTSCRPPTPMTMRSAPPSNTESATSASTTSSFAATPAAAASPRCWSRSRRIARRTSGRWVEFTKPAHQLVAAAQVPEAERLTATIKAHVQFQLDNLMTYADRARRRRRRAPQRPRLALRHGPGRALAPTTRSRASWRGLLDKG